jgi:hypothetical protein
MAALKTNAKPIQTTLHQVASFTLTAWACRWKTPKSRANIPKTKTLKATHIHVESMPRSFVQIRIHTPYFYAVKTDLVASHAKPAHFRKTVQVAAIVPSSKICRGAVG